MPSGSRVSRETRRLLLTVLLSVIALLVLARIRFPERPAPPALVPPLLTQLTPATPFEDLSRAVAALEADVTPSLQLLRFAPPTASAGSRVALALRFRPDMAAAIVPSGEAVEGDLVARDRATGLAIVRTLPAPVPDRPIWTPEGEAPPRYLLVAEASRAGASLRPVFVGALAKATSAAWNAPVWIVPRSMELPPGAFVFTTSGALAGAVVEDFDSLALVPATIVVDAAARLLAAPPPPPGALGIEVQELTPRIAAAVGVPSGVVVTHVDAAGPASDALVPTDVIEAVNDEPIAGPSGWLARIARLGAGEQVALRVRRSGRTADVRLTAAAMPPDRPQPALGLAMRPRRGLGAEVLVVRPASAGERAGIRAGDIVTRAGETASPTPAELTRAFDALPAGGALLVAITRGGQHLVAAVAKP